MERRAAASPEAIFARDERRREMTFAELRQRALGMAADLAARGVGEDTVVSWQLPNWMEAATLTLALSRLGAIQNPLIPILRSREVGFICSQARTRLLVVPSQWRGFDYAQMAADVAGAVDGMDVLVLEPGSAETGDGQHLPSLAAATPAQDSDPPIRWYFYTSGTTADPKGAQHTDMTLLGGTAGYVDALSITGDDRLSLVIPVTHIGGIIHILASLVTGCEALFAEVFDPRTTAIQLREQQATIVPGGLPFVHAFFAFAANHPELDPLFPHARAMTHGGSPKPPQLLADARERFGLPIVSGYGMTECPMAVWNRPDEDHDDLATSEGRPVAGVEIAVVGADGKLVNAGQEGEIRLRGPQLMKGYVDASLDAGAIDEDGYFCSGDLGTMDEQFRVRITGRLKDIIIRNMENISALEVEHLLYTHPKVADVAVIGIANPRTGEHACAVVVAVDDADRPDLAELRYHLRGAGLSDRKHPEQLEFVDALPRNAMEKVQKAQLRRQFDPGAAGANVGGG
jgi:acyl-CoA synthetase (AMP-forming)/AMP-acid ligase II